MKNSIILKSAVCGLIIGIAIAVSMITGLGNQAIYYLSLGFILNYLGLTDENMIIVMIPFSIIVWTIYGTIIGILLNKFKRY